jgi:hypothetical protein
MDGLRSSGVETGGPAPYGVREKQDFLPPPPPFPPGLTDPDPLLDPPLLRVGELIPGAQLVGRPDAVLGLGPPP